MGDTVMVLEKEKDRCIVVTDGGEFLRLGCPSHVEVGDVVPLTELRRISRRSTPVMRKVVAAAAMLLIMIGMAGWWYIGPLEAAVVIIDINPSLEVHLDAQGLVTEIEPLNGDAETILEGLQTTGLSLEKAISSIIDAAMTCDYLRYQDEQNMLIVSVVENDSLRSRIRRIETVDETEIEEILVETLGDKGISAMVAVQRADMEQYRESRKLGTSVNKVRAARFAESENLDVSLDELTTRGFKQVIQGKQIPPGLLLGQSVHILEVKPKDLPQHPGHGFDKEEKQRQGQKENDHQNGQTAEGNGEGGQKTQPGNGGKKGKLGGNPSKDNDGTYTNSGSSEDKDVSTPGKSNQGEDKNEDDKPQPNDDNSDGDGIEDPNNDEKPPSEDKGSKSQENKGAGNSGKSSQKGH